MRKIGKHRKFLLLLLFLLLLFNRDSNPPPPTRESIVTMIGLKVTVLIFFKKIHICYIKNLFDFNSKIVVI